MYKSIQACRGLAALVVMLFHLGGTVALDRYFGAKAFDTPTSFGDCGVSFFFVLSGFVITLAHRKDFGRPSAVWTYLVKRAVRIYPAFLIVAGVIYLGTMWTPSLHASMPSSLSEILTSALLIPQDPLRTTGTSTSVLVVAWSLQYEVFFYTLTALMIVRPSLWVITVISLAIVFIIARLDFAPTFPLSFFTSESVPLFWLGMALAYLVRSRTEIAHPIRVALVGLIAFAAMALYETNVGKMPHRESMYGLASAFLIVGLVRMESQASKPWTLRPLVLLGDASYALYLIHFPLISVIAKVVRSSGMTAIGGAVTTYVLSIVASIGAAVVFHLWIEKPVMRALSPTSRARPPQDALPRPSQQTP